MLSISSPQRCSERERSLEYAMNIKGNSVTWTRHTSITKNIINKLQQFLFIGKNIVIACYVVASLRNYYSKILENIERLKEKYFVNSLREPLMKL